MNPSDCHDGHLTCLSSVSSLISLEKQCTNPEILVWHGSSGTLDATWLVANQGGLIASLSSTRRSRLREFNSIWQAARRTHTCSSHVCSSLWLTTCGTGETRDRPVVAMLRVATLVLASRIPRKTERESCQRAEMRRDEVATHRAPRIERGFGASEIDPRSAVRGPRSNARFEGSSPSR